MHDAEMCNPATVVVVTIQHHASDPRLLSSDLACLLAAARPHSPVAQGGPTPLFCVPLQAVWL